MRWVHIDFWFDKQKYNDISSDQKAQFEDLLRRYLKWVRPFIRRKFYLYEHTPHCFLALELRSVLFFYIIQFVLIRFIRKPLFIIKAQGNLTNGGDKGNGEGFLNILNAFTDFYLFQRDCRVTHIIHCCLEFMTCNRQAENEFYQNMAIMYQDVVLDEDGKKIFMYKEITPELREKIKAYDVSWDLRNGR